MPQSKSASICIAGGGIVGLSSAYFLAKIGYEVVLIERDSIGSHASGFAYGSLSPLGEAGRENEILPELDIARIGMRIHTEFSTKLPNETGIDIQHRFRPSLDLAFDTTEVETAQLQVGWRNKEKGYFSEWMEGDTAREIVPSLSPEIMGAVFTQGVADVDPYRLTLALTEACESMGVEIQHGEVKGVSKMNGNVSAIETSSGRILCERVVIALGPWSGLASSWLGVKVPIRPLKGQILRLKAPATPVICSVGWQGNYVCTKPDGLLWAGTTEEENGFDESPTTDGRDQVLFALQKMISGLDDAELIQQTACLRPLPIDGQIILGPITDRKDIIIATGAGRKGILLGPAMGKIVSELICEKQPEVDIAPFSPSRFSA